MINPDGVYAGNYRTSLIGKDLNRLYIQERDDDNRDYIEKVLIPEITAIKQLVTDCKKQMLCFIDVHHHCGKRGSFMYGPSTQM